MSSSGGVDVEKTVLKKACNEMVRPSEFLDYREYLDAVYNELKKHDSKYTYFDFSEDAGLGHNNLMNALIRGRRPLTLKTCKKIAAHLGIVGRQRQFFEALVEHSYAKDPVVRESIFRRLVNLKSNLTVNELDRWQLEFFSHWSHAVLLELMNCSECSLELEWFQQRILPKISTEEIRSGLELLCRIGYAKKDEELGKYISLRQDVATGAEVASVAIVRYHQTLLDLAKSAVVDCPSEEREMNSLVLTLTTDEFEALKGEIQSISQKIFDAHPQRIADSSSRVVQISMQVFPLTRAFGERNEKK